VDSSSAGIFVKAAGLCSVSDLLGLRAELPFHTPTLRTVSLQRARMTTKPSLDTPDRKCSFGGRENCMILVARTKTFLLRT
jgi:hypothetical protein